MKLLPCPFCGSDDVHIDQYNHLNINVVCDNCHMCGPMCKNELRELAVERWNSLPRRLRWTKEAPTTTGFYMHKYNDNNSPIRIRSVLECDNQLITLALDGFEIIPVEKVYGKWAGPIAMPVEK